jgi:hypothetical protein
MVEISRLDSMANQHENRELTIEELHRKRN